MKTREITMTNPSLEAGQALLTMLIFMTIGIMVLSAATIVLVTNIFGSVTAEQGLTAYYAAESGAEDGLLHVLRDPSVSGTLPSYAVGDARASVTITNGTIVSVGTYGKAVRTVRIKTTNTNGIVSVTSWKEGN